MIPLILAALLTQSGPTPSPVTAAQLHALTYTTADKTYYVDPLGSDSNPCTSSGVSACLTIKGALAKVSKVIRHRVIIEVAAGNYAGFIVAGFTIDPQSMPITVGLLVRGTLTNSTIATGSAAGTATNGTAGTGVTFGTLVHTGQTWTVNDLRGRFVVISSGTGVDQTFPISSNTVDTITVVGTWTAPDATSIYAIRQPSSFITTPTTAVKGALDGGSALSAYAIAVTGNTGPGSVALSPSGPIAIKNFDLTETPSSNHVFVQDNTAPVILTHLRTPTNATAFTSVQAEFNTSVYVGQSYFTPVSINGSVIAVNTTMQVTNTLFHNALVTSSIAVQSGAGSDVTLTSNEMINLRWFVYGPRLSRTSAASNRIRCGIATSYAFAIFGNGPSGTGINATSPDPASLLLTANYLENCDYGVRIEGGTATLRGILTGAVNVTGLQAARGAQVVMEFVPTFTTVTADAEIDSVTPASITSSSRYAFTDIADGYCAGSLGTSTRVCKQVGSGVGVQGARILNRTILPAFNGIAGAGSLSTCSATLEGGIEADGLSGVATGKRTKICGCTSNGSSVWSWQNLATGTLGTTTTCGTE